MRRALVIALALGGCHGATEVVVVFETDLRVPDDVNDLLVGVSLPDRNLSIFSHEYALAAASLPASLDLTDPNRTAETVSVEASLSGAMGNVHRKALFPFALDQSLELHMLLGGACLGVTCADPTETCIDGMCTAAAVPVGGFVPLRPDPLKPLDGGGGCPPASPPTPRAGCTVYDFTSGTSSLFPAPSEATVTYECGMLHVQIPQGTHQWLAAHTPFLMTAPPESGTFTATTRVHGAVPAYDNFGGVVAYVSSTDEVEVEGEHSNGGATPEDDGAFGHVGGVFMNFGVANKPARETRELTLHRKAVSVTTSTYDFSDGDGPVDSDVDVPLIPVDQSPGIFAGNTGGAFDLYFEWLQVCTP